MAVESETGQRIPLGVGKILNDSFVILFGSFFKVLVIGAVPTFAAMALFVIFARYVTFNTALLDGPGAALTLPVLGIIFMTGYGLVAGLIVQLAYDVRLERPRSLGTYIGLVLPALLPIVVLSVVVTVLSFVGALAFMIGALWVYAVFSVMVPAAVIERAGFGAMGRSASLTKEYRWPIVGTLIVVAVFNTLLSRLARLMAEQTLGALGWYTLVMSDVAIYFAYGVVMSLIVGLGFAYGGIVTALIYARLREIKESADIDQLATVFD